MKIILFSGSHPRHLFVHKKLLHGGFSVSGVVLMEREALIPACPKDVEERDANLFQRHFLKRNEVEAREYGDLDVSLFRGIPMLSIQRSELNGPKVVEFVKANPADACFIFGSGIILEPVLSFLPDWRINLHLGFSPRYRGSATLFWPFYFLEPQWAGATFHQIVPEADAGGIVEQVIPSLMRGRGIHEHSAAVVRHSAEILPKLFAKLRDQGALSIRKQKSTGKLFLSTDFQPAHLRVIYDLYEDRVIDAYLDGHLQGKQPKPYHQE